MGKLVGIMDAVMPKWDRNRNRISRDKTIGQEEVAVIIEEAVGEARRGGRRHRHRWLQLQALARTFHVPMC